MIRVIKLRTRFEGRTARTNELRSAYKMLSRKRCKKVPLWRSKHIYRLILNWMKGVAMNVSILIH